MYNDETRITMYKTIRHKLSVYYSGIDKKVIMLQLSVYYSGIIVICVLFWDRYV